MTHDTIIVLDFGSQYAQLIARRVREQAVYSELVHWNDPAEKVLAGKQVKGFILSGGDDGRSSQAGRGAAEATPRP